MDEKAGPLLSIGMEGPEEGTKETLIFGAVVDLFTGLFDGIPMAFLVMITGLFCALLLLLFEGMMLLMLLEFLSSDWYITDEGAVEKEFFEVEDEDEGEGTGRDLKERAWERGVRVEMVTMVVEIALFFPGENVSRRLTEVWV